MMHHKFPKAFRQKVKRYLDYVIDYKRQFKLGEDEVLGMLSESL